MNSKTISKNRYFNKLQVNNLLVNDLKVNEISKKKCNCSDNSSISYLISIYISNATLKDNKLIINDYKDFNLTMFSNRPDKKKFNFKGNDAEEFLENSYKNNIKKTFQDFSEHPPNASICYDNKMYIVTLIDFDHKYFTIKPFDDQEKIEFENKPINLFIDNLSGCFWVDLGAYVIEAAVAVAIPGVAAIALFAVGTLNILLEVLKGFNVNIGLPLSDIQKALEIIDVFGFITNAVCIAFTGQQWTFEDLTS